MYVAAFWGIVGLGLVAVPIAGVWLVVVLAMDRTAELRRLHLEDVVGDAGKAKTAEQKQHDDNETAGLLFAIVVGLGFVGAGVYSFHNCAERWDQFDHDHAPAAAAK